MSPASLCPGFQETRPAPSHVARSLPGGRAARLSAPRAAYTGTSARAAYTETSCLRGTCTPLQPPGDQQGAEAARRARVPPKQRRGGRCFWWCHGKSVLVCSCQSLCYYSLLLKISWQKTHSHFYSTAQLPLRHC